MPAGRQARHACGDIAGIGVMGVRDAGKVRPCGGMRLLHAAALGFPLLRQAKARRGPLPEAFRHWAQGIEALAGVFDPQPEEVGVGPLQGLPVGQHERHAVGAGLENVEALA